MHLEMHQIVMLKILINIFKFVSKMNVIISFFISMKIIYLDYWKQDKVVKPVDDDVNTREDEEKAMEKV